MKNKSDSCGIKVQVLVEKTDLCPSLSCAAACKTTRQKFAVLEELVTAIDINDESQQILFHVNFDYGKECPFHTQDNRCQSQLKAALS